jgi:NAD+ kinase
MATVALMVHHQRPEAADLADVAAQWLEARGHEVRLLAADARLAHLERWACEPDELCPGLDVAVSLGGDGTMLRTVDLVAGEEVPVIGVNLGQLGYLTEVEPDALLVALKRFLAGSYQIEERMRLTVEVDARPGEEGGARPGVHPALNEAVVEKTPSGHTVRLAVSVDGEFFTTYATDGLIVATPTGSTAYAFSARGPIVSPKHSALVLTPVSPHMLFDRSLVLEPTAVVRIEVLPERQATVSVDGRNLGDLAGGDAVVVTGAKHPARLVTFGPRNFLGILKVKFGLNDR